MKHFIYTILAGFLIAGCSDVYQEEAFNPILDDNYSIQAIIDQENQTRSDINCWGVMSWTDDDYIGVFGEQTPNAKFHHITNGNNANNFVGNFDNERDQIKFAYYPYNEDVNFEEGKIEFEIPELNNYCAENKAPMIGKTISDKQLFFKQTGGVLLLKIIGDSDGMATVEIKADDNSPYLSGRLTIDNIEDEYPTFKIKDGKHRIAYDVSSLVENKPFRLYIPLQIGTYNKLTVSVLDKDGGVIKTVSLSNTIIKRGTLINTKTIELSGEVYCVILPSEYLEGTEWTNGLITSSEQLILHKENPDQSSLLTILDIHSQDMLSIRTDSLNNISDISFNEDEYISFIHQDDGNVLLYYLHDNSIEYFESTKNEEAQTFPYMTRAGVEQTQFFQKFNDIWSIYNIIKSYIQNGMMEAIKKLLELLANNKLADANEWADFIISSADVPGFMAYVEKKYNQTAERLYSEICGDMIISTIDPTITNDNRIKFGYKLHNISSIPSGNLGFDRINRECSICVKKVRNGTDVSIYSIEHSSPIYKENISDAPSEKYFYMTFEKGYTYYFISKIIVTAAKNGVDNVDSSFYGSGSIFHTICYNSDISYISSDNIGEIEVYSNDYENGKINFNYRIYGDFGFDYVPNWGINLYYQGQKVPFDDSSFLISAYQCKTIVSEEQLNLNFNDFTASTKGKWQIGTYTTIQYGSEIKRIDSVPIDLELVYDKYPSVTFFNPGLRPTETISTRADDDDDEKYRTPFFYDLDVTGGFWIERYDAKSDTEGTIYKLSYPNSPNDQQAGKYEYAWIYSKKHPISPTLWYDIKLKNGTTIQSINNLKFSGCPIDKIDYDKGPFISNP